MELKRLANLIIFVICLSWTSTVSEGTLLPLKKEIVHTVYPKIMADVLIEDFDGPDALSNWQFSNGPEFPGAEGSFSIVPGKGSNETNAGGLNYDFRNGGAYVSTTRWLPVPLECEGISFLLSEHTPGTRILIRVIDETNQTFQKFITIRPESETQSIEYTVAIKDYELYFGGAEDGVFHGALRAVSLGLEKGVNFYKTGRVLFDNVKALGSLSGSKVSIDPFGADGGSSFYQGRISDLIGVNIHFIEPDIRQLNKAVAAGFGFVRMDLFWPEVERQKGVYDFSGYDRLMAALEARGLGALFILGYANPLYYGGPGEFDDKWGPSTAASRNAYARFAAEAAQHFKDKNIMLEIWNESNIPMFWHPEPNAKDYQKLAAAALKAIKKAAPEVPVLIGATSGCDAPFLDTVLRSKQLKNMDAVTIHPYRMNDPESFYQEYLVVDRVVMKRTGRSDVPVYSGEWGYSSTWYGGRTSKAWKRQANYAIRIILTNILCGVKKTVYYDLMDDGNDPKDKEHNFGLVKYRTLGNKKAFNAIKALKDLLPDEYCEAAPINTHHHSVYGILFRGSQKSLAALWTIRPAPGQMIEIPHQAGMKFFNMYRKKLKVNVENGSAVFTIKEDSGPVYIQY